MASRFRLGLGVVDPDRSPLNTFFSWTPHAEFLVFEQHDEPPYDRGHCADRILCANASSRPLHLPPQLEQPAAARVVQLDTLHAM